MIKIGSDTPGRITVTFPYSPEVVAKIKTIKNRRWHPEEKYWSFPQSESALNEILSALEEEEVDIDPSLHALASEVEREKQRDRSAPMETACGSWNA
jgi:hypothetical protein